MPKYLVNISFWMSLAANLTAVILLFITLYEFLPWLKEVRRVVTISAPFHGSSVERDTMVLGTSEKKFGFVYMIVRDSRGRKFGHPDPNEISSAGDWLANVVIGEGNSGCGQTYLLRAAWAPDNKSELKEAGILDLQMLSDEVAVFKHC